MSEKVKIRASWFRLQYPEKFTKQKDKLYFEKAFFFQESV